jgi:hypothetical protein
LTLIPAIGQHFLAAVEQGDGANANVFDAQPLGNIVNTFSVTLRQ